MMLLRRPCCILKDGLHLRRYLSFQDLDVNVKLTRLLRIKGITEPSNIQVKAIPFLLDGNNAVINSETGSGKTLAYALPILSKVEEIKKRGLKLPSPYGLVVVPNTELQYQVGNVFRRLLGANVCIASEASPMRLTNTEVVVSTPTHLITYPSNVFRQVQTVVFDEADIMIARKVGKHGRKDPLFNLVKYLIEPSHLEPAVEKRQFIFVGATMPDNVSRKSKFALPYIRSWVPDISIIQSENVHKMMTNVEMIYKNVLEGNKLKLLVDILKGSSSLNKLHVLVFVNKVDSVTSLFNSLTRFNYNDGRADYPVDDTNFLNNLRNFHLEWSGDIHMLHKDIDVKERFSTFDRFSTSPKCLVITTDIASRGIDFPHIDIVVQYDFAKNAIDVLHRAGRTGRMGREGKVVNFITEADEGLANMLQQISEDGETLDSLFSRHRSLGRKVKRMERALQRDDNENEAVGDDVPFSEAKT